LKAVQIEVTGLIDERRDSSATSRLKKESEMELESFFITENEKKKDGRTSLKKPDSSMTIRSHRTQRRGSKLPIRKESEKRKDSSV